MEIGVYHEFHCRPEQTAAAAFEEALGQIEAADRWGLDAIWLAEIHQQARRSVLAAPLTVAAAIAARTQRIQKFMTNLFQGGDSVAGPADNLRVVTLLDRGVQYL